jgi:hypothetical protein
MTDIIERAEDALTMPFGDKKRTVISELVPELVAELKAARAENERLWWLAAANAAETTP